MTNELTLDQIMDLTRGIPLTRNVLKTALATANDEQRAFIADLLTAEHASRKQAKQDRLLRQAKFPVRKTLNNYDYSMITWPTGWQQSDLLSLDFITNHHDLVFYGDMGTGKTHRAIGLGHAACQARYTTRFFTAASLIAFLRQAQDKGTLNAAITTIGKAKLITIDEFGYPPSTSPGPASYTRSSLTPTKPSPSSTPRTLSFPAGEQYSGTRTWPPRSSTTPSTTDTSSTSPEPPGD